MTHHASLVLRGAHHLICILDRRIHTQGRVKDLRLLESIDLDESITAEEIKEELVEVTRGRSREAEFSTALTR